MRRAIDPRLEKNALGRMDGWLLADLDYGVAEIRAVAAATEVYYVFSPFERCVILDAVDRAAREGAGVGAAALHLGLIRSRVERWRKRRRLELKGVA